MNKQGQYKEAIRTLNKEVKELREQLVEAGSQKQKLQKEVTALQEKAETAGADAVSRSSKHPSHSLAPVLTTTALVLMIASASGVSFLEAGLVWDFNGRT